MAGTDLQGKTVAGDLQKVEKGRIVALPRRRKNSMRRRFEITKYRLSDVWNSKSLALRIFAFVLSVAAVALPVWSRGWRYGVTGSIFYCIVLGVRGVRDSSPKNMQIVQHGYLRRKLSFYKIIEDLQLAPRLALQPDAVKRFQQEALSLIAQYVRDHRHDHRALIVFANLLVEDGDEMVVVARDQPHRPGPSRHPKSCSIVYKALHEGEPQCTGNVYGDYPDTIPGKRYKSILAIPVKLDGQVLGVVSIDSSKHFHFDGDFTDLVNYINPYVGVLGWTLKLHQAQALPATGTT